MAKRTKFVVLNSGSLTDEILHTTMCLVEKTLNTCLLIAVFDDSEV